MSTAPAFANQARDPHAPGADSERVPHTRMRRAIIRTVNASAAIPQFSLSDVVDTRAAREVVRVHREEGRSTSLSDVLHLAVARTLVDHGLLNASYEESATLLHREVHLAFIVEVPGGMLTPVIRHAQRLDLAALSDLRRNLTGRALNGTLHPHELADGTFTVSNLGAIGVRQFNAMVLPPQSAVLAVGSRDAHGRISLTLSVDHRVVDGATAARFLSDLRGRLEEPTTAPAPATRTDDDS